MADENGSAQSQSIWPLPKFHFNVKIGDDEVAFQEVSGLDMETEPLEYRAGNSPEFWKVKMPGMKKFSNITLKKGMFKSDNKFFTWFEKVKMNVIERKPMTISLLDESQAPVVTWSVKNAFPIKISGTDLKAEGNEIAIETIEVAHEGIKIENK